MSKEIDQRVVEMRFDNAQFERNASNTMSTLDKLKSKLNFKDSGKGLENIGSAVKKVDMNGLAKGIETVHARFSALEVVGVTALANITNSAVNAGKRIASALTIEPVITGFQEYETQMNAIQTILANTQSKGSTLEDVTAALDELNAYADQTIYNFTEMTRNIGTFTAAGVDLDKSVTSIKGIANLAAVSGSNAQQASTAMYQLSQALAAGRVSLMDWNSVVNAGMGGELFQNALKRTATQMGHNVDALIEKYGSFRESLTKGQWLTAEVLTETLTQLSGAYSEADLIAQGYSKEQAQQIVELANTAVDAATKVKTFTQLWDTAKEAAQSGWAQTWKLIFGDFEEAKVFFTDLSETINDFIISSSDARNKVLGDALGGGTSKWDELIKKINDAGVSTEVFESKLKETAKENGVAIDELIKKHGSLAKAFTSGEISANVVIKTIKKLADSFGTASDTTGDLTSKLEYYNDVIGKVINGNFGNAEERIKALTAAGYDHTVVQALVNKVWERNGKTWSDCTVTSEELAEVIGSLSEKELTNIGYTKEQAAALKELAKQAEETGTPLNDLINDLSKPSGREMLLGSLSNAIKGIIGLLTTVRSAWANIFPPEELSKTLYNAIAGLYEFSKILVISDESADKLRRTFEGLFAMVDLLTTLFGGAFKLGFEVISAVLGRFNLDILDVAAGIGDALVAFRDFVLDNGLVAKAVDVSADAIVNLIEIVRKLINAFFELPFVKNTIDNIANGFVNLKDVGSQTIEGLKNGLQEGIYSIPAILIEIGNAILNAIKSVLGIHSPSTEMFEVGKNVVIGLANGIRDGVSYLLDALKVIGSTIIDFIGDINWGYLMSVGLSVGLFVTLNKFANAISLLARPLGSIAELSEAFSEGITRMSKAISMSMRASAIKDLAIAIALLAGSVFILAKLPTGDLFKAIAAIAALAGVITLLSVAINKFGPTSSVKLLGFGAAMVGISTSLLIAAFALNKLNSLDIEKLPSTLGTFGVIITGLTALVVSFGTFVKGSSAKYINKFGRMMITLSVSMLLMIAVIKLVSGLSAGEVVKGGAAIAAFTGIVASMALITKLGNNNISQLGKMMVSLSASLLLMIAAIKLISGLSVGELLKGGAAILAFSGIVALLANIAKKYGPAEIGRLGTVLLSISSAMLILSGVVFLLSGLSVGDIVKGEAAIVGFVGIIALLINAMKGFEKDAPKISLTLLAMSVSIGILAGVTVVLSMIDIGGLAKGVVAVGMLGSIVAGLILVTKYAQNIKGTMIAISVSLGILSAALITLTLLDPKRLAVASASLSIVVGMFALLVKASNNVKSSIGTLVVMSTAIGLIGGIIYLLSTLPIESVLGTTASISLLLISLSASMKLLSGMKKISGTASLALLSMVAAIGGIALILGVLDKLDVSLSLENALALSTLLLALTSAMAILSAVGLGATAAIGGALALSGVILVLGGFMAGIAALNQYVFDGTLGTFIGSAIPILESIGQGIGSFFGGIISGVGAGITSTLPAISESLAKFMENLSGIDPKTIDSVKSLAEAIILLSGATLLNGIANLIPFGPTFKDLGDQLIPFGEAMVKFSNVISGNIDVDAINAAANAGKMLAELSSNLPRSGGLLHDILGEQDLGKFGEQLKAFGEAITGFSSAVGGGKIDASAVQAAADAGMILSNLANNIPKSGGLLQNILGEQDLGVFGEQLKAFGEAIVGFSSTVGGGNIDPSAVQAAADAGMILSNFANNIPKSGGFLQALLGEQDIGTFGEQLKGYGECIVGFNNALKGSEIDSASVEAAANAGSVMAALANNLPKTGGFLDGILGGKQTMSEFGSQLKEFGEGIAGFASNIVDINPESINSMVSAIQAISDLQNGLQEDGLFSGKTSISDFGYNLSSFGSQLSNYYSKISEIDAGKLSSVTKELSGVVSLFRNMSGLDTSAMSGFAKGLKDLGKTSVDGFIKAFDGANARVQQAVKTMLNGFTTAANSAKGQIKTSFDGLMDGALKSITSKQKAMSDAGVEVVKQFVSGITKNQKTASDAIDDMLYGMRSSITSQTQSFYNAGRSLVQGLTNGIRAYAPIAKAEANNLARQVRTSFENALDINSPSKDFFKLGGYIVTGLVNGIKNQYGYARDASSMLGTVMLDSIKEKLEINSPSQVFRDEVGRFIVVGIAEGIEETTTAEEAAAQKAQNIVNAFKEELDNIDLKSTTSELEYNLWESLNPNASDSTVAAKKALYLLDKIEDLKERVQYANAEYQATVQSIGEGSSEAVEAYNKLLQEQINLADTVADYNQSYRESINPDLPDTFNILNVADVMEEAMKNFEIVYSDTMDSSLTAIQQKSEEAGSNVAVSIADGIESSAPDITEETISALDETLVAVNDETPKWIEAAKNLIGGFVQGIKDKFSEVRNVSAQMVQQAQTATTTEMDANSPSRLFMTIGGYVVSGFASGIRNNIKESNESSRDMVKSTIDIAKSSVSKLIDVINSDADLQPTIRPVMDLSEVESGARTLNTLFSRNQAMSISNSRLNKNPTSDNQNGVSNGNSNVTYRFEQNNYSPKALSRVEIYRQTRNQLSALERMVKK